MKKYKPTTPGRRGMSTVSYRKKLTTSSPHKALTKGVKRSVGRNNQGRLTTRHKGGGHKRRFRVIDFKYNTNPTKKSPDIWRKTFEYFKKVVKV